MGAYKHMCKCASIHTHIHTHTQTYIHIQYTHSHIYIHIHTHLPCARRLLCNIVPVVPGGGVVFYVSQVAHSYIQNSEEREEAGTPNIIGCVRAGLVYHVHSALEQRKLETLEHDMAHQLLRTLHALPRIHVLSARGGSGVLSETHSGCGGVHVAAIVSFKVLCGNVYVEREGDRERERYV